MHNTISILGCGWLGTQLGISLLSKGYHVNGSTTTPSRIFELAEAEIKPFYLKIEPGVDKIVSEDFFNADVLVISLPPGRDKVVESAFPRQILEVIKLVKETGIPKVLFISSTSVYQATNSEAYEGKEGTPEKPSGRALLKAEKLLLDETEFKTTVVRFGGLIGPGRNPARFFAGKENIPGKVPVNLIHSTDCINIIEKIIENNIWGEVFNACSPEHPTREEFYLRACAVSKLPAPKFTDKPEKYKIIKSDKLRRKLNYKFQYVNPIDSLSDI
jgi:nucleoside-diphosphate-sugar epimerase